jgi:hypothetical protein
MGGFVQSKVNAMRGSGAKPMDFCSTLSVTVPVPAACSSRIDVGGVFTAKAEGAAKGVEITIVQSAHVNNAPPSLLSEAERANLKANGAEREYGPAVGFVIRFTNGLVAYLTSDTAVFGDMKLVIHDFYKPNLAVLNLGPNPGIFYTGAYAMNDLVQPGSVILTHANEPVTEGGKLRPSSQTARIIKQIKAPSHLAISEHTMEFDGQGKCVGGC